MRVARRFLAVATVWLAIIAVPMIVLDVMAGEFGATKLLRGLAGAIVLAGFPAGIAAAKDVPAVRPWRPLMELAVGAVVLALVAFALIGWVPGLIGDEQAMLTRHATPMRANDGNWETINDAAWRFYSALLTPLSSVLYSTLGFQLGIWSGYAVPSAFRRTLYWAVASGLIVAGFVVSDSAYETFVLHTGADAGFAAFLPILFPLGLVAGFALPTVAWLRGAGWSGERGR